MDHTASIIPLISAAKDHSVAFSKRYAWSQIDVVADQESVTIEVNQKLLMTAALVVVA